MKRFGQAHSHTLPVLALNVLLLALAIFLYGRYASLYQERLREENLGNIANLNQSAASNATALITSWDIKLNDIKRYVTRHGLTRDQALALLDDVNSKESRMFELIGGDYTGFLSRRDDTGAFIPVDYRHASYAALQEIFDGGPQRAEGLRFAPEFTDSYTAAKHFALYTYLSLLDENAGRTDYTLMLSSNAKDVLAAFNTQNVFTGLSTVLIDGKGRYIVSSRDFKSDNFFQYLYVYNDLTLDQRESVAAQMAQNGSGELYYLNAMGQQCVFRYARMTMSDWYCITCVPLASFRTPVFRVNFVLLAVLSLLALLALDVLWLRQLNHKLRVSMLREKEASNAKTDFLSRMSHDIRTPLNGIIGLTTLAMDEKNPRKTTEYLDNIKASGDFLLGLVNDVLDMSRVESGKMTLNPEPYSQAEFCRYIQAVIAPLCRDKEQKFIITPPADDSLVMLDKLRVNQIFFNLLSNAVKYTPRGGQVELSWERSPIGDQKAAFDFTVRDNGIGMSEAFQARMFDSFSQEHAGMAATGAGLGLSIVWNLIRLMGGAIRAESREGQGTAFFVHLECEVCKESMKASPAPDMDALAGKRALICEDNQINAMIARGLLVKWRMLADIAANGKEGLDRFAASAPGYYDAILMDIRMPEMNGLDATRAIRSLDRSDASTVAILAMTANAYDTDVKNCLDAGMNAHVGKPIQPALLQRLLIEFIKNK